MTDKSISVEVSPVDKRCKYWAKVVRADAELPIPEQVLGGDDIPGRYLQLGEEELFSGDFLFEGEAISHKHNHGWAYYVTFMSDNGDKVVIRPTSAHKTAAKDGGLPKELLKGSGELAAAVRLAHAVRLGINVRLKE